MESPDRRSSQCRGRAPTVAIALATQLATIRSGVTENISGAPPGSRPKPGPYEGTDTAEAPAAQTNGNAPVSSNGHSSHEKPAATENVPADGPAEAS